MFNRSDVNERAGEYNALLDSISLINNHGGFADLAPQVLEYMDSAEPVGLDQQGNVVFPYRYSPDNGPPVLMIRPDEQLAAAGVRGVASEVRIARELVRQTGETSVLQKEALDMRMTIGEQCLAMVKHSAIPVTAHQDPTDTFTVHLPRMLILNARRIPPERLGSIFAHEVDHWNFGINQQGAMQSTPGKRLTPHQLLAASEKQALKTSYTIERNLGAYAGMSTIAVIAEAYASITPSEAGTLVEDLITQRSRTRTVRGLMAPLASMVVSELFGNPDEYVTLDELAAFQAMGLVLTNETP
ncbi:MAG: hypothetical protein ACQR33_06590 [Candidatus Saccharibacteria bacterium]